MDAIVWGPRRDPRITTALSKLADPVYMSSHPKSWIRVLNRIETELPVIDKSRVAANRLLVPTLDTGIQTGWVSSPFSSCSVTWGGVTAHRTRFLFTMCMVCEKTSFWKHPTPRHFSHGHTVRTVRDASLGTPPDITSITLSSIAFSLRQLPLSRKTSKTLIHRLQ